MNISSILPPHRGLDHDTHSLPLRHRAHVRLPGAGARGPGGQLSRRMWCPITFRRWGKRLLVLAFSAGCLSLAVRAMEQASGYGSVGSILLHPLHLCAHFAKEGPLELLLDVIEQLGPWSPFSVDATNSFGMTALHTAALRGSDWAAALLLEAGADPAARNTQDMTVLMVARSSYEIELVRSGPRRIAAYLINGGACSREQCEPSDVQAMREYEVLAAGTSYARNPGANNKLPGGPQLELDERAALYGTLWERAHGQHVAEGSGDGRCETCALLADMHAMVWQLRHNEVLTSRVKGKKQMVKEYKDNATAWLERSFKHNPVYPRMAARQRALLAAADAGVELTLASGKPGARRVRLERQHPTEPILLVRGLLTPAECDGLIDRAEAKFNQSMVGGMVRLPEI